MSDLISVPEPPRPPALPLEYFDQPFLEVAQDLVGKNLVWGECGGQVVEVEAYGITGDAACHTASRASSRDFCSRFPPGTAYVYLNYGIHWMLNVLARDGILLIRALRPVWGIPRMQQRRGQQDLRALCSGPGKIGQALGLTAADHGTDLRNGFWFAGDPAEVVTSPRIGITKAVDLPWRFTLLRSPWVSGRRMNSGRDGTSPIAYRRSNSS